MEFSSHGLLDGTRCATNMSDDPRLSQFWGAIGRHVLTLQQCSPDVIYLVAYPWLSKQTRIIVVSWVNGSCALPSHRELPKLLQSHDVMTVAWIMISLARFENLISHEIKRRDVRPVDDLNALVNGDWVWPRTELIRRMTQSLTGFICTESQKPNVSPEMRYLSTVLRSFSAFTDDREPFFDQFWALRFRGFSHLESFSRAKQCGSIEQRVTCLSEAKLKWVGTSPSLRGH